MAWLASASPGRKTCSRPSPATLSQFRGTQFSFSGGWVDPTINVDNDATLPLAGVSPFEAKSEQPGSALGNIATREDNPMLVPLIHTQGQFNRMRARHELMKKKYPDKKKAYGIPYTGLSNARPETKAIADHVRQNIENLPFEIRGYIEFEIPGSKADPDFGR